MKETTIKLSREFKDWLTSHGKKGESYEDVIKRLSYEGVIKRLLKKK